MSKQIPLSSELKESFNRLIANQTGLAIRQQDQTLFSQKILSRMKALKLSSPDNYYQLLASTTTASDQEWQILITLLTNNESYFFRDQAQLKVLEKYILPEIIKRQASNKTIRICSAGCSTGEEPYSIAILLKEMIPNFRQWNITLLGIDINQVALDKAQKGIYGPWSFRGVKEEIKKQYFSYLKDEYHLSPEIKKMVKFNKVNLVEKALAQTHSDLKNMDLIICRNVFIYFELSTIAKVIDDFYEALKPSGYFLTGHTELYGYNLRQFNAKIFPESLIYQRQDNPLNSHKSLDLTSINNDHLSSKQDLSKKDWAVPKEIIENKTANSDQIELQPKKLGFNSTDQACRQSYIVNDHQKKIQRNETPTFNEQVIKRESDQDLLQEAENLLKQDNYDLAIQQINQALQIQPQSFLAYYLLAKIHANLGKYEAAIRYCYQALQVDDFSVKPYYLLAHIAEEQGDLTEAKQMLKKIIYLDPSSVDAYLNLSQIYQQEGDAKRTIKMQQAAFNILKQVPPHP